MSRFDKVVVAGAAVAIALVGAVGVISGVREQDRRNACFDMGGVDARVNGHGVCIDRASLRVIRADGPK